MAMITQNVIPHMRALGMTWFVTVCDHVNAGFITRDDAQLHFARCADAIRDLTTLKPALKLCRLRPEQPEAYEVIVQFPLAGR